MSLKRILGITIILSGLIFLGTAFAFFNPGQMEIFSNQLFKPYGVKISSKVEKNLILSKGTSKIKKSEKVLVPKKMIPSKAMWVSNNKDLYRLGKEVSDLYMELCKAGILPVEELPLSKDTYIINIMREKRYFLGEWTFELSELLCSLNHRSKSCKSQRKPNDWPEDKLAPPCGFPVTKDTENSTFEPKWKFKKDDTLAIIPAIKFNKNTFLKSYSPRFFTKFIERRTPDELVQVVKEHLGGCEGVSNFTCKQLIARNNPAMNIDWSDASDQIMVSHGEAILLPAVQGEAEISIHYIPHLYEKLKPNLILGSKFQHQTSINFSPIDIPLSKISRECENMEVPQQYFLFKNRYQAFCERFVSVLKEIQVPDSFPAVKNPIYVGILDNFPDPTHCMFKNHWDYKVIGVLPAGFKEEKYYRETPNCRKIISNPGEWHHAMHLAGILALKEKKMFSYKKFSDQIRVVVYPLDFEPTFNLQESAKKLWDPYTGLLLTGLRPEIINMSFSYVEEGYDEFKNQIKEIIPHPLYVAAAGEPKDKDSWKKGIQNIKECTISPACWNRSEKNFSHVMSVVGVNLSAENSPVKWEGSNWGKAFDLGAPGVNIPSTLRGGKLGFMSGSSQAAIIVSGAAGIVWEIFRSLDQTPKAIVIRNRLIYSGNITPKIYNISYGGILNLKRASNIDSEVLLLKPDKKVVIENGEKYEDKSTNEYANQPFVANLESACRVLSFVYKDGAPEETNHVLLWQLRRLVYHRETQTYTMFYHPGSWRENSRISRVEIRNIKVVKNTKFEEEDPERLNLVFRIKPGNGPSFKMFIAPKNIVDLTLSEVLPYAFEEGGLKYESWQDYGLRVCSFSVPPLD